MFDDLKQRGYFGKKKSFAKGEMFPWKDINQTPQIFIDGLETSPIWPESRRKDLPIVDVLEDNYASIKEETIKAFNTSYVDEAYRFLFSGGQWNQILLYHG